MQFLALFICSAVVAMASATKDATTPETLVLHPPVGRVRGSVMTSRLGKKIYAFRGLRFAEPPVGERRFEPPVPVVPWSDVFDATQDSTSCPQVTLPNQSEDCLRLNVYTTKLPAVTKSNSSGNPKRPVIVYFHAGAFYVLSGQSLLAGPEYYMDQEIVLVTVNYRLGSLGFIATGDALAPGNLGLKDQVVALRWVQSNIATFGGDPNCVTISGSSAGGWSVVLHMLSPMTKGLFHRAIALSGSIVNNVPLPTHQTHYAKKQAEIGGCPTNSTASILNCLRTRPVSDFAQAIPKFYEWNNAPKLLWLPVVEPDVPGVERYLPEQPVELIRQGKIHNVPLIVGCTKDELAGAVVSIVEEARKGNTSVFRDYNEDWDRITPISFGYERDTPKSRAISRELRQFYLQGQPLSLQNIDGLAKLLTDSLIFGVNRFVNLLGQYGTKPIYYYQFTYQGRYSYSVWSDTKKPYGVVHHDDRLYLFYNSYFPYFDKDAPENVTIDRLTAMHAHFAKTGEPIPPNDPKFANVVWTPFTVENKKYLEIGNELVMKSNLLADRMAEWERLFPLPPPKTKGHH